MVCVTKFLTAVLAASATIVVQDLDIPDLVTCLGSIGQTTILDLSLATNSFTEFPSDLFTSMEMLEKLDVSANELTTVQAGTFSNLGQLQQLLMYDNKIATIEADAFADLSSLRILTLAGNVLPAIQAGYFNGLGSLEDLYLQSNSIATLDEDSFQSLVNLEELSLETNAITTLQAGLFDGLDSLNGLRLKTNKIATIEAGAFDSLGSLTLLGLADNELTTLPAGVFDNLGALTLLGLALNRLTTLRAGLFDNLAVIETLILSSNALTTLPAGIFEDAGPSSLQSLPTFPKVKEPVGNITECYNTGTPFGCCGSDNRGPMIEELLGIYQVTRTYNVFPLGCEPADAVQCDTELVCQPGSVGYNCVPPTPAPPTRPRIYNACQSRPSCVACSDDNECNTAGGEVCCPLTRLCENADEVNFDAGACGDPHMTGFLGQKFDFVGEDNGWYGVVSDLPYMHLNMRVTSPVPSVPEITYITGISVVTKDVIGLDHSIVISVGDPQSLDSSCPVGISPCLADGALNVVVDGEQVLLAPGEVALAPGVSIAAVNLPGACRSFGFETYWEQKKLEALAESSRRLGLVNQMQDMSEWVLSDPTATNKVECAEYVDLATGVGGVGMFAHQSEHASFQIVTPTATIRLSHGRLHQLPMRNPTDMFDLPDHLTWQMNLAIDHSDMSPDATGILGETLVPTVDEKGAAIMNGMDAIRGTQEDYRVKGPLGVVFAQGQRRN